MVLAGDRIFAAGWIDSVRIHEETTGPIKDAGAAFLWIISTKDGEKLHAVKLDSRPVFDGMIAAGGNLYLSLVDGTVHCFRSR